METEVKLELPKEFINLVETKFNFYGLTGGTAITADQQAYNAAQRNGLVLPQAEYDRKWAQLKADFDRQGYTVSFDNAWLDEVAGKEGHPDAPTWGLSQIPTCMCGECEIPEDAWQNRKVWLRTDMTNGQSLRTAAHELGHVLARAWNALPPVPMLELAKKLGAGDLDEVMAEAFSVAYAVEVLHIDVNLEQCASYCASHSYGNLEMVIMGLGTASKLLTQYKEQYS